MRKIFINGYKGLTVEIGSDSLSYAELKETAEVLIQPTLPMVYIPKDLFFRVYPKMMSVQEAINDYIIQTESMEARMPILDNLALAEKLKDMISRIPPKVEVDTNDLPKQRYHDRTFPKDYWKKKKAKRRKQNQSRNANR